MLSKYLNYFKKPLHGWIGTYDSWKDAKQDCTGYDSEIIFSKLVDSITKVKDGKAAFERDGVIFDKIHYSFPLLSALLLISSKENSLNLIDFGGALGSSYYQNRNLLAHLHEIKWNVIEQPALIEIGKVHFSSKELFFYNSIEDCFKENTPSAIIVLSTLQYLESPQLLIQEIISRNFSYIFFDRTPFTDAPNNLISRQIVSPEIYEASYPCWIFNEVEFLKLFVDKYDLIYDFEASHYKQKISKYNMYFKGHLFKKREH